MSVTPIPVETPIASLRLTLASPAQIRSWSYGEVTETTTLHYQTQQPEENGLFCERSFPGWCVQPAESSWPPRLSGENAWDILPW